MEYDHFAYGEALANRFPTPRNILTSSPPLGLKIYSDLRISSQM